MVERVVVAGIANEDSTKHVLLLAIYHQLFVHAFWLI